MPNFKAVLARVAQVERDSKNLTCPESRLINSLIGARGSALPLSARLAGLVGKGGTCRPRVGKRISVGATLSGRLQGRKTERGGTGCFAAAAAAAGLRCLLSLSPSRSTGLLPPSFLLFAFLPRGVSNVRAPWIIPAEKIKRKGALLPLHRACGTFFVPFGLIDFSEGGN